MASLIENVNQTIADFDAIQAAINEQAGEGTVPAGTPTSEYADKIRGIVTASDISVDGGSAETGKYVNSVTKSGSTIKVTKLALPTSISGNAGTATKLATARTIKLTGDVTGSATFDGSADASITAVVVDNSHNHITSNITDLQTALDAKQNKLTAGEGISISGSTISSNLNVFNVVTELPATGTAGRVYLVKDTDPGTNNTYIEYVWINSKWEKLGEYAASVDLTPYMKTADANAKFQPKGSYAAASHTLDSHTGTLSGSKITGDVASAAVATAVKDYADANKKILIGFAGEGLTSATAKYMAAYDANGAHIKDISAAETLKFIGAAAASHTHALSGISDLHANWDAVLKVAPTAYMTRWPAWSEIANKPTILSSVPAATASALGGIKVGYTASGKNYPVKLDANNNAYVSVPWTDTVVSIPSLSGGAAATSGQYVSGVTVSGHTVTVTKAALPAAPTVNNATVTIKQAGATKGSFTLNQSGNATIELTDNNTTYGDATQSADGLMTAEDKKKLDGITANADSVAFSSNLTSGTQIGTITINGAATAIYAPASSAVTLDAIKSAWLNKTLSLGANEMVAFGAASNITRTYGGRVELAGGNYETTLSTLALKMSTSGTNKININGQSGVITASDRINATNGFYETSDERLKDFHDDIKIDFDQLLAIPTKYFSWKTEDKINIGTSAQEVQKIYPELVSSDEKGELSVDYAKLSVICLAAIKELKKEIDELKSI